MKQGNNKNRNRGHNRNNNGYRNNRPNIPSKNQVFESNGPAGKIRGNLMQLIEKYLAAGKDAISQDDIVTAENCFQHADHYTRLYNLANAYENSRKEEMFRQQQLQKNETEEQQDTDDAASADNADDAGEETLPEKEEENTDNIETEPLKPIMIARASEPAKEKDKIADLPFLNTAINLPETDGKEEAPKRKRIILRNRKKNDAAAANDTETAATAITPTDATA